MNTQEQEILKYYAYKLRLASLRATTAAGSGHLTSCLSAADIMSALFFHAIHVDLDDLSKETNDRFILSKGHAAPVLYAAIAQWGLVSEQELLTLRQLGSRLEGHPVPACPFVDVATGSLGIGLSAGVGMAINAQRKKLPYYTYVLLGDSELTEGAIWEAAALASYNELEQLIALVDVNGLGQRGVTIEQHETQKIAKKFEAFGWETQCINGHDIAQIVQALDWARTGDSPLTLTDARTPYEARNKPNSLESSESMLAPQGERDQAKLANKNRVPKIIIANTVKGYGLHTLENKQGFHGKALEQKDLEPAERELKERFWNSQLSEPAPAHPEVRAEKNLALAKEQAASLVGSSGTRTRIKKITREKISLTAPRYIMGELISTREAFGHALEFAGNTAPNLWCLDAEVSNSTYTNYFAQKFPERFVECFIAEQNMIGMGMGIATRGNIALCSTFSAFLTRAFDQLRMAAISHIPLSIVGSHAGVSIGQDGPSQMGLEDIAMMRTIPESTVFYPCDAVSCQKLLERALNYHSGISYLRTTRNSTPIIYAQDTLFNENFHVLKKSDMDAALVIGAGITVHEVLKAHTLLAQKNIPIAVADLYCIKPLDNKKLLALARTCNNQIIVVEDHYQAGGIFDTVCCALAHDNITCYGLAVKQIPHSASSEEQLKLNSIDAHAVIELVYKIVKN